MVVTKCKTALLIKNDYNWPAALGVGMLDILSDAVFFNIACLFSIRL